MLKIELGAGGRALQREILVDITGRYIADRGEGKSHWYFRKDKKSRIRGYVNLPEKDGEYLFEEIRFTKKPTLGYHPIISGQDGLRIDERKVISIDDMFELSPEDVNRWFDRGNCS